MTRPAGISAGAVAEPSGGPDPSLGGAVNFRIGASVVSFYTARRFEQPGARTAVLRSRPRRSV
ncbi:protein of unknown function [Candidatus Methylocalor cossyra]|uniref:Uncharacterized protein n=1 Tax=Candidatus Methylocalor cossyra TaxID=3108543 RepID=A0ABM9NHP7_9GAMM